MTPHSACIAWSLTFGIAYTNDPKVEDDADSALEVVRNSSKFGPLSVTWTWMLVCGARGRGNETSIGACDASPFVKVVAIARVDVGVLVRAKVAGQVREAEIHSAHVRLSQQSHHRPNAITRCSHPLHQPQIAHDTWLTSTFD